MFILLSASSVSASFENSGGSLEEVSSAGKKEIFTSHQIVQPPLSFSRQKKKKKKEGKKASF